MLVAILAIDKNSGLGYKNNILFKFTEDMEHFYNLTSYYKNCVVGRKTYESLPLKRFENRILKVMTKQNKDSYCSVLASTEDQIVIGGNEIYKLFKDLIAVWYITYFKEAANNVDVYLDKEVLEVISKTQTKEVIYENDHLQICKCY